LGKIQKLGVRNSMAYRLPNSRKSNFATEPYVAHHHAERPHQGKGNVILFPAAQEEPDSDSPVKRRERLGGLLKYYHRKAA
jgi:hypothetical protein